MHMEILTIPMEKLSDLEKRLGDSYSENLGIRLDRNSPIYMEIVKIAGNTKEIKRLMNLN